MYPPATIGGPVTVPLVFEDTVAIRLKFVPAPLRRLTLVVVRTLVPAGKAPGTVVEVPVDVAVPVAVTVAVKLGVAVAVGLGGMVGTDVSVGAGVSDSSHPGPVSFMTGMMYW